MDRRIVSCSPNVFGRVFGGTFTWVLSGFCHALPFEEAWKHAVEACKDLYDEVVCPLPQDPIGTYYSQSGREYHLSFVSREGRRGAYVIECPDDTSLDVAAAQAAEVAITGHPDCCKL